jgi:uncharacterized protein YceH (UPF0502 family)
MSGSDRPGGGSLLLAFLAGAAAGALVAWLSTRRPGERGRETGDLLRGAADAAARAARAAREAFERARGAASEGTET